MIYRIRVDLDNSWPPIWRRLDVRSDAKLDVVHQVVQAAFGWEDRHLYRFSLGGDPLDPRNRHFLCPWDEDDGELASQTALTDVLKEPGGVLHYVYDYGDYWGLTLRLEEVLPAEDSSPTAVVRDGRRAAPPEDCGGIRDGERLAEVLKDPARFELDEINEALRGSFFVLRERGLDSRLVDLVHRLSSSPVGEEMRKRASEVLSRPTTVEQSDLVTHLRAHQWFLDRAADGGIPLTSAGYLKPSDVEAVVKVVPAMGDWPGDSNREVHCPPLLDFRQTVQSMGLLRKSKGALVLTRAGAAAQRDASKLWDHLAARLIRDGDGAFEDHATLLLLAYAGSSDSTVLPLDEIASALTELGWRHSDGDTVEGYRLRRLPAYDVLANVSERSASWRERHDLNPVAASLARAALRR